MKASAVLMVIVVLLVGTYAVWNYAEVRSTIEGLQKEWRIRNWDQRIKDKIGELDQKVEEKKEAVITLQVKSRDVMRKLKNEEETYDKYDEVIRGLVAEINKAKEDPTINSFEYCGKTYTIDEAKETFEKWTAELLPIKKRIDYLQKQKEMYQKSIASINDAIDKMRVNIQGLEQRALELATMRDTLKAQELAKELVLDAAEVDETGVKQLIQEMQGYIDEIDIKLNSDFGAATDSSLENAVKYKENIEQDSDLAKLREKYLNQ